MKNIVAHAAYQLVVILALLFAGQLIQVQVRFVRTRFITVYSLVLRESVTRHNTLWTVLKRAYFMAVIGGVFCLDAPRVIYKRETLSYFIYLFYFNM